MAISVISRYNHTAIIEVINSAERTVEREHLDIRPRLVLTLSSDNFEYTPDRKDNWSRIAWRTLGNGRHWWIIADHSGIVDPFSDLLARERPQYVAQLTAPITSGEKTTMTVDRPKRMFRGLVYRVEDLDPTSSVSTDVSVLDIDNDTGVVNFSPATFSGTIPAATSRVSIVRKVDVSLTIPGINRALFTALDFDNKLVTLVE